MSSFDWRIQALEAQYTSKQHAVTNNEYLQAVLRTAGGFTFTLAWLRVESADRWG